MKYPLAQYTEEPVTDYPLTKDELRGLALFWAKKFLSTSMFCCHAGQVGVTDLRMRDYVNDRLGRIAAIIGEVEVKKAHAEVEQNMRDRPGEELWTEFLEGRSADWIPSHAKKTRLRPRR
jgi:hypothetical protein